MVSGSADTRRTSGAPSLRPWAVLRAALITLALVVHGALALPWVEVDAADLRYDLADDELARWSSALSGLGVSVGPAQLAEWVLAVGRVGRKTRKALRRPFRPLFRVTGTGQAWGLFAFPDPYPGRLVIAARETGGVSWRTLYRAPGQGEGWLIDLLENRRIRGIYDDAGDRPRAGFLWNRLCDELGRRIFRRHPELQVVELRFDVRHITPPGGSGGRGGERVRHRRIRTRAALLGVPGEEASPTTGASDATPALRGPVGTP